MKSRHFIAPAVLGVALAASGLTFAQAPGGSSNYNAGTGGNTVEGTTPNGTDGSASGVYPTQKGVEQNPPATGTGTTSAKHHYKHHGKKHTKKHTKMHTKKTTNEYNNMNSNDTDNTNTASPSAPAVPNPGSAAGGH